MKMPSIHGEKNSNCELFFFFFWLRRDSIWTCLRAQKGEKKTEERNVFFFFKVKMKAGYRTSC